MFTGQKRLEKNFFNSVSAIKRFRTSSNYAGLRFSLFTFENNVNSTTKIIIFCSFTTFYTNLDRHEKDGTLYLVKQTFYKIAL